MEMHELFYEDEKFELFVKKFKEEFTTGLNRDENQAGTSGARHGNGNDDVGYAGHCNDEDDVGHANDEDDDEAAEEKEANEATKKKEEAEKLAAANKKEAAEKSAKQAAEKNAKEAKEKAEKEAAEKAEREIEAAKKNKQAAEKEKKEKAEKEAAEKKKAEMRKAIAEKKEQAEMQAAAEAKLKDKNAEPTAEKGVDVSEATTVPKSFESPKVQQKMFGKGQESTEKPKGKRITKPSVYLKSPFMNKMVKTQDKLDEDEILCARSVFCMQGDISEVVFDDGKGTIAHRKEMQSLAPGIEIEKQIIDTFVTVLNYEERIRTDGKDLRRRYFPTDAVLLNEDKDQAKQYESFENVIKNQMNASESKKKMKDVELAFFPKVVAAGQYYVIVFNLLKANAVILDNEKHDDYNKYKEVFDSVKHQHPCVEKLSKDKPAKVLKMKWKTEKNKIDSGLYMMMHMELYQGESATNWKTDIVQENNRDYEI
ncbi:peptidase C48, SUMO/sentrin/Ubl1 [Tanacetum coccineum]